MTSYQRNVIEVKIKIYDKKNAKQTGCSSIKNIGQLVELALFVSLFLHKWHISYQNR